ncbi:hypothetical protein, partial [Penaeicola halotolerans]|uniref:hypothetical protein n=1 Tax=Penaeicola halotolerans TaxID=2793196 RepID=UPI001CF84DCD
MLKAFYFSLPIQLLVTHFKENILLLIIWLLLFLIVTGRFVSVLGIPYLVLDPEYLNQVVFTSSFIIGFVV